MRSLRLVSIIPMRLLLLIRKLTSGFFRRTCHQLFGPPIRRDNCGHDYGANTNGFSFPLLAGGLVPSVLSLPKRGRHWVNRERGAAFYGWIVSTVLRENWMLLAVVLAVLTFPREMVSVAFGMIALFYVGRHGDRRYNIFVLGCSTSCFNGYLLMRTYGNVPGYEFQLRRSA